jgi:hypothetical protein
MTKFGDELKGFGGFFGVWNWAQFGGCLTQIGDVLMGFWGGRGDFF